MAGLGGDFDFGDDDGFLDYFLSLGDEAADDLGPLGAPLEVPEERKEAGGAGGGAAGSGVPALQAALRTSSTEDLNPAWLARAV
eukprot:CAMPEP_0118876572 /NCGR_PEP_ID=MMETSP1163-20130328/17212_1 /TAXON_ID=124430 /ORGANISM="Phaeomonas parva, Strain CCMP2877" /LENGTH=83 /DNA_ID=CAMNT_0006812191 /DNA_START=142 /DNA_END=389 /DNA_ORIENTATION=-